VKIKSISTVFAIVLLSVSKIDAQAFDKDTKLLSVNLGWGDMEHFPVGNANPYNTDLFGKSIKRLIPTGQISVSGEFAIHKYIGIGFLVGLGGNPTALFREVNIIGGVLTNFHFYQFLADKKVKNIHQDRLDIYVGLLVGTGVAIHPYGDNSLFYQNTFYDVLLCVGPHIGFNYYFKKNVAFNGQLGFGMNIVQAGFAFKLGNHKSLKTSQ
jgi:hypothetical protein